MFFLLLSALFGCVSHLKGRYYLFCFSIIWGERLEVPMEQKKGLAASELFLMQQALLLEIKLFRSCIYLLLKIYFILVHYYRIVLIPANVTHIFCLAYTEIVSIPTILHQ